jgi:hypothetical protein
MERTSAGGRATAVQTMSRATNAANSTSTCGHCGATDCAEHCPTFSDGDRPRPGYLCARRRRAPFHSARPCGRRCLTAFVSTRALGRLISDRFPGHKTLPEYGRATINVFAALHEIYSSGASSQEHEQFSKRIARLDSEAATIEHRTRLAAMFQLPASRTLTRPDEVGLHYVSAGDHCDWWMVSPERRQMALAN